MPAELSRPKQESRRPAAEAKTGELQPNSPESENGLSPERALWAPRKVLRPSDILNLQRTVGNRAVQRLLQRQAQETKPEPSKEQTAPAKSAAQDSKVAKLKDQKIGQWGDETPLILPEEDKLVATWGDDQDYGGDEGIKSFVDTILQRFEERKKKGLAQGSERVAAQLKPEALKAEYLLMRKFHANKGNVRTLKREWLSALPSRLDAACVSQPGVNYDNWIFSPYEVKAPTTQEIKPIPESIPLISTNLKNTSDAMVAFMEKLEPLASAKGLYFGVQNRASHSNGWGVDFYLVEKKGSSQPLTDKSEGFWNPDKSAEFLKLFDDAAAQAGVVWHVIYNDPRVAKEVNLYYKEKWQAKKMTAMVSFGGAYRRDKNTNDIERNFHGPIVLHFHVDIIWNAKHVRPTQKPPTPAATPESK
ncbi:MAG: hypothetical protein WCF84_04060 [Anaerolineae bacterium]